MVLRAIIVMFMLTLGAASGFAQAVFGISSAAATGVDIGHAELTGSLTMTVVSSVTLAAPVVISYSAPITNNAAAEISVLGTGGLFGVAPTPILDRPGNAIIINIPAGATGGSLIRITGVRVAIAGLELGQRVRATITFPQGGNSIVVGQSNPIVIDSFVQPFSIDQSQTPPLSFRNGVATNPNTDFFLTEGFPGVFTSTVGLGGQTVASRIRLTPFPAIPDGVQLTFAPVAASGETGATLTTLSGVAETVPRTDGSSDVTFEFSSVIDSAITIESFRFYVTMTIQPPATTGTIQFQAALVPIGLATPTQQFPSTDIPRYNERLVPDETLLVSGTSELVFPFRIKSDGTYTGVALTNPQNFRVLATLTALDANGTLVSGAGITNPVTVTLPRNGQFARVAREIFGSNFNASSPGSIRVLGRTSQLPGFYLIGDESGPKLDGSTGDIAGVMSWYLPVVFRQGSGPFNLLEFYNPGTADAEMTLRLRDERGGLVRSVQQIVTAGATVMRDLKDIFGVSLESFQGGYIAGISNLPVVVRETFGNALDSNVLAAQAALALTSFYGPHFAVGDGYSTELTIVNADTAATANITLTLLDNSGAALPIAGNPLKVRISAGAQLTQTLAVLFPLLGPNLATGSIKVDVEPFPVGPFISVPLLVGAVRFSAADGSASAALPLVLPPTRDFVYSHVAQNLGYYTGVALLNSTAASASFTLQVYTKEGVQVGFFSSLLRPGEKIARLIYELVTASAGQIGGYIRITSTGPLTSFALFGTNDGRSLSAIPPQSLR